MSAFPLCNWCGHHHEKGEACKSGNSYLAKEEVFGDRSLKSAIGRHIAEVMRLCNGNKTRAAIELEIDRRTQLYGFFKTDKTWAFQSNPTPRIQREP